MNRTIPLSLALVYLALLQPSLPPQAPAPATLSGLVRSMAPAASTIPYNITSQGSYSVPPVNLIRNRARTLGDDTV